MININICNGNILIQSPAQLPLRKNVSSTSWRAVRKNMVSGREEKAYKRTGPTSLEACAHNLFENKKGNISPYSIGQHSYAGLFYKNGRHKDSENDFSL